MAKSFNIRRSMVNYSQNVSDGSERLKIALAKNNIVRLDSVTLLMNDLSTMSLQNIEASIERAANSKVAIEELTEILQNEKKRKETAKRVRI